LGRGVNEWREEGELWWLWWSAPTPDTADVSLATIEARTCTASAHAIVSRNTAKPREKERRRAEETWWSEEEDEMEDPEAPGVPRVVRRRIRGGRSTNTPATRTQELSADCRRAGIGTPDCETNDAKAAERDEDEGVDDCEESAEATV
jgi:hypothetical protein